jgi:L,D-peptidoglycan transpeptidase YkuD (ErfK/YbiS/YcfS/YnhG family)
VGRNGVSDRHREGDGTTPAGAYRIGPVVYGTGPDPGVRYRYRRLVCGDWWDEDPASPTYNTFQHVACGTAPTFGAGSEALWKATRTYAHFVVIDYNARPAVPGRGSAIFIHAGVGPATTGCVRLPAPDLIRLLRWLRPGDAPLVVIGTRARIHRF